VTSVRSIERGTVVLEKYCVDSVIGRGGMGLVIKAWHLGLDEEVAIKMLRDDVAIADETITRFIREAQAAAKLKSEHIARIIDVGRFGDGKPYLVMEFLEGQDVGQLIAEHGRLQPSLAIDLVIQACEALAEAHSLGIVHRDIKPTNLFLTSRPDGSVLLKILDFGISKSPSGAELSLTQTWSLLGSPAYMSPEQMRSARHVDARTDIWSLGAVLYEAIEGRRPFQAESFSEMCVMVAVDPPAPMTATPRELVSIIERCLAKSPAERYASVADLACDLACLAREPDKAQVLVDRMYRMLRRGALRRTPAGGVPTGQLPPVASATPPGLPAVDALGRTPPGGMRVAAPSPPSGVPVTVAHMGSPWHPLDAAAAGMAGAPAVEALVDPPPAIRPVHPAYTHAVPLPALLQGDACFLHPGFALPCGATGVTATHVVRRRDRGWLVSLIAAVVVLAAAAMVILAVGSSRAAGRPSGGAGVLRVTPDPAPAAGSAAPDRGTAPRPAPDPH
jgi:eukaryotic-like serine/threonine-protein kinase